MRIPAIRKPCVHWDWMSFVRVSWTENNVYECECECHWNGREEINCVCVCVFARTVLVGRKSRCYIAAAIRDTKTLKLLLFLRVRHSPYIWRLWPASTALVHAQIIFIISGSLLFGKQIFSSHFNCLKYFILHHIMCVCVWLSFFFFLFVHSFLRVVLSSLYERRDVFGWMMLVSVVIIIMHHNVRFVVLPVECLCEVLADMRIHFCGFLLSLFLSFSLSFHHVTPLSHNRICFEIILKVYAFILSALSGDTTTACNQTTKCTLRIMMLSCNWNKYLHTVRSESTVRVLT